MYTKETYTITPVSPRPEILGSFQWEAENTRRGTRATSYGGCGPQNVTRSVKPIKRRSSTSRAITFPHPPPSPDTQLFAVVIYWYVDTRNARERLFSTPRRLRRAFRRDGPETHLSRDQPPTRDAGSRTTRWDATTAHLDSNCAVRAVCSSLELHPHRLGPHLRSIRRRKAL